MNSVVHRVGDRLDGVEADHVGEGERAHRVRAALDHAGVDVVGRREPRLEHADRRERRYRHERHDQDWWKQHYIVIVLVGGGYYFQDSGYWYPAWGYDLNHERYDYDGPIYTYGNLLPDQVIVNVQRALKDLGYYAGDLNGSLGVDTRQALSVYQQDYGLDTTGAVDEATVRALGLI